MLTMQSVKPPKLVISVHGILIPIMSLYPMPYGCVSGTRLGVTVTCPFQPSLVIPCSVSMIPDPPEVATSAIMAITAGGELQRQNASAHMKVCCKMSSLLMLNSCEPGQDTLESCCTVSGLYHRNQIFRAKV